ncbi:hypothetical protein IWQ55_006214 [Labrenzia sp. EL_208]|uniref:hypothetical protein n=1 Tax=Roseibium album TaxID=311410 RepID=UPI0018CB70F7|nr:hypothetical protein [Roseibium album]MBG6158391.1 hypothetical protein [Labrenzia sp. EL_162]MBG6172971.1 hypothetical protein [Labrenzia sp. EL_132]MBG6196596.1 hypothetical protein [Labrenzia sp. EL_159]MBG6226810.1 hypothetical protein [Labrenzia sp. EL_208]MBG6178357.1 hypothetical protein [Labrenzia sp. EL_132]
MTAKRTTAAPKAGHFVLLEDHGDLVRGKVLWLEPDAIKALDGKIRPASERDKSIAAVSG